MLTISKDKLKAKAEDLENHLQGLDGFDIKIVETESEVGGGSLPLEKLPSYGLSISHDRCSEVDIERCLRYYETPIIGRIQDERVLLDIRTIFDDEYEIIRKALETLED